MGDDTLNESITIRPATHPDWETWNALRQTLWPDAGGPDDEAEMHRYLVGE